MERKTKKELKSWGKALIIALGIAFVTRTFFFAPYTVKGESMEPTLHDQEKVFVNKFNANDRYHRGDIVIIKGKEKNYVKRIIGLPGDKIFMENDKLFIDGVLCKEPYLSQNLKLAMKEGSNLTGDFGPITVPHNKYFVMGDNRLKSEDSRNGLGFIRKQSIIGKSEFVFFPFSHFRNVE
ncbi:signal peptidase I [Heyndrickxia sporothermodurans]|uniref:signal peptidase I n=1 Tax=Heyndrickxia sporothermodurans TaxID=46224 RepID=UPI002DBD9C67|nr:signal peptidase I [Heyndrickxia sporothermodurans]MEB6550755.1 signal peptidase I [Heyndrickxia sporothermodurans]MED3652840.1 signal peptidase I [Heyndrickxia sporothermodurans]MED3780280.1 signal peptidase I [Heyndrickxia sporothermodurans]